MMTHMDVGAGCVEHHVDVFGVVENPLRSRVRGLDPVVFRPSQAVAFGVDANESDELQHVAAQHLVHQVGADVPGADDRASQCHLLLLSDDFQRDGSQVIELGSERIARLDGNHGMQRSGHDDAAGR